MPATTLSHHVQSANPQNSTAAGGSNTGGAHRATSAAQAAAVLLSLRGCHGAAA
ncbi:hypothetical protein [Streptomyces sp. NPDC018584]|uniref:hypothetical protein n=1 Tax=unclassified Streptomyces TaxID=2593676 RepID=UPI00379EB213